MNVYQNWDNISIDNAAVTLGTFDGVHLGHKFVCNQLIYKAKAIDGCSVVITFYPHPRIVLNQAKDLKLIQSIEEKIETFKKVGIDHLVIIPFDEKWADLNAEDFLKEVFSKIRPKAFYLGYDHKFGKNREGNIQLVEKLSKTYSYQCEVLKEFEVLKNVSSTNIRTLIKAGEITKANQLLDQPFSMSGTIVKGQQIGHTISFPTANIDLQDEYKIVPAIGAYAVIVHHKGEQYKGMLNIGFRPTVNGKELSIEVHIIDFNKQIYGDKLTVRFIERIRTEIRFETIESLKIQLIKDKNASNEILSAIYPINI